jgi:NSS family neurotransmitter:Na+ symporter
MLSGFFFAFAVIRYGVDRFRERVVNTEGCDLRIGRWWNVAIPLVALQAVVLMGWWLWQAVNPSDLAATFTPFSTFNVGSVLVQWSVAIAAFLALNRWLVRISGADRLARVDE